MNDIGDLNGGAMAPKAAAAAWQKRLAAARRRALKQSKA